MRGIFGYVIAAGLMVPAGFGQSLFDQASFKSMSLGGVHLYGVTVYSGYTTSAYPGSFGQTPSPTSGLGPDVDYGAATSVGWQYHRQRTDFGITYALNYGGFARYSDANAFSQSLNLSLSRTLSQKWTLVLSGGVSDSTAVQYLYQPSNVALMTQVPATMDDLAAAFKLGQFSSNQVASMLTGAPLLDNPARNLLLGARILTYSGQASLNYAHSSRLSFHFAAFTAAGQNRTGGGGDVPAQSYVMPHSVGLNAGMGMSYMLSPRTQVGVDVEESRTVNRYQGAYTTTASVSVGRKMSPRWFVSGHVGGSMSQMTTQVFGTPQTTQAAFGGSVGFRTFQHSLVGSYDRSGADPFGFAVGANTSLQRASCRCCWREPS